MEGCRLGREGAGGGDRDHGRGGVSRPHRRVSGTPSTRTPAVALRGWKLVPITCTVLVEWWVVELRSAIVVTVKCLVVPGQAWDRPAGLAVEVGGAVDGG